MAFAQKVLSAQTHEWHFFASDLTQSTDHSVLAGFLIRYMDFCWQPPGPLWLIFVSCLRRLLLPCGGCGAGLSPNNQLHAQFSWAVIRRCQICLVSVLRHGVQVWDRNRFIGQWKRFSGCNFKLLSVDYYCFSARQHYSTTIISLRDVDFVVFFWYFLMDDTRKLISKWHFWVFLAVPIKSRFPKLLTANWYLDADRTDILTTTLTRYWRQIVTEHEPVLDVDQYWFWIRFRFWTYYQTWFKLRLGYRTQISTGTRRGSG